MYSYLINKNKRPCLQLGIFCIMMFLCISSSHADISPIVGSPNGSTFTDPNTATQRLTGIKLRSSTWIDAIQGVSDTGVLPNHGGTGGTAVNVTWPSNEYLVRTYGSYNGSYLGQISFVTNTGRILGPYGTPNYPTKTVVTYILFVIPIFTQVPDYSTFDYTVPAGQIISGFTGRASTVLNALGVISNPILPANAIRCANEGATCSIPTGTVATVYYGANGKYNIKTGVTGNIGCNNGIFGDPIGLTGKSCSYVATGITPSGAVFCAPENGLCTIPAGVTASVYYGVGGVNGANFVKTGITGSIACNNTTFGDPVPFASKSCNYISTSTPPPPPPPAPAVLPDLSVSVLQPVPTLAANAMSEVEVTVSNTGTGLARAPIVVNFTLPTNVSAPLKFTRAAEHWICLAPIKTITCVYDLDLANGANTTLRIPVTPAANTVGTTPAPFVASVNQVTGETALTNNGPVNMTPSNPVANLNVSVIADPLGIYSLPILDATTVPKFASPMPNLLAPAYKHKANVTAVPGSDSYTLDIKKIKAQILPPGYPATDVFAYGDPANPLTFSYPAHTIEARSTNIAVNASGLGRPVNVQYLNTSAATEHVLSFVDPVLGTSSIVDRTITGANSISPTNLREEIRTVAHLHGATSINQQSNGHPEAWSSPAGQRGVGASANPTVPFNASPFLYNNNQEAAMLWYHDNTLGLTRLNVYAGLAGLYAIRDDNEVRMINNNQLPSGAYEVPLILQDRMFKADGSLAYPDIDLNAQSPSWVKEFFGDVMVVNGVAWPYFQVEPRKYRFRLVNAANMRIFKLSLDNSANTAAQIPFQVIATDGGFLNAPVTTNSLTIAPGERYDVIIDFAALNGANITLRNTAGTPFAASTVIGGEVAPVAGVHDLVMQFRVNMPLSNTPISSTPTSLRTPIVALTPTIPTPGKFSITEVIDASNRVKPLLGTTDLGPKLWTDAVTEIVPSNWVVNGEIYNNTPNTNAIHIHGGFFQIVDRQPFNAVLGLSGQLTNISFPSAATPASPLENGWKDTVIVYPSQTNNPGTLVGDSVNGMVTRIRMKFQTPGEYLWHSQMLEHKDYEMQRPITVN